MHSRCRHWFLTAICLFAAGAANAQSISLVSGNGQLLGTAQQSQPVIVIVRDASGNPVNNNTVNWSITPSGSGSLSATQTITGSNGQTQIFMTTTSNPNLGSSTFLQSTVTATGAAGNFVNFTITTVQTVNGAPAYNVQLISPSLNAALTGQAGSQGSVPVKINIKGSTTGNEQGIGIPGVALTINSVPRNPSAPATLACSPQIVYTDTTGTATCNLEFGGKVGSGSFSIIYGGAFSFSGYSYQVTAGAPAAWVNLLGNNQSGNPGTVLGRHLQGTLTDMGGNLVPGIPVTFTANPLGSVVLSNASTTTDANGNAGAVATLGTGAGPVTVVLSTQSGITATFSLTINVIISGMTITSGNQQSALVNAPFTNPLTVQVVDNGAPVPGISVAFTVTNGSAVVGTATATTDANGLASTTATAGPNAGPVVITATATGTNNTTVSQTFNLTVTPPGPVCDQPQVFFNGASFAPNQISPGAVAVMDCVSGIADGIQGVVSGDTSYGIGPTVLPTQIQGVSLKFGETSNSVYAPLFYLANINGQESVAFQVPFELYPLASGQNTVQLTVNNNNLNATLTAPLAQGAPGIFEWTPANSTSKYAIMLHADGSLVTAQKPAQASETLRAYVTGLIPPFDSSGGSMVSSNTLGSTAGVTITTPVIVSLNSASVNIKGDFPPVVTYAEGMIGVWQVEFVVPASPKTGSNVPFNVGIPVNGANVWAKASHIPVGPQ